MGDQAKHRLTDAELDEALKQARGSLRLTAALCELKEVRPVVAAARAWLEGDGGLGTLVDALVELRDPEESDG